MDTLLFTVAAKNNRISWNKPDKEMKNTYNENFKSLKKDQEMH